jgi:hypothetical protein
VFNYWLSCKFDDIDYHAGPAHDCINEEIFLVQTVHMGIYAAGGLSDSIYFFARQGHEYGIFPGTTTPAMTMFPLKGAA